METDKHIPARDLLKGLSEKDFLSFGMQQVAYVRPVTVENRTAWSIHAADGTPLSVMDDRDVALALVRHNELEPVTLQ